MDAPQCPSEEVFLTAARCADCPHPPCMAACPEQVDLKALFEFVAAQAPLPLVWTRKVSEAEALTGEAIQNSYL